MKPVIKKVYRQVYDQVNARVRDQALPFDPYGEFVMRLRKYEQVYWSVRLYVGEQRVKTNTAPFRNFFSSYIQKAVQKMRGCWSKN
jgi:hypothetical protein